MPFAKRRGAAPIYGTATHRKARAMLLAAFTPGDPCCLCGHPMWPLPNGKTSNLHADHIPGTTRYRGLAHGAKCQTCGKRCNQVDGAKRGRARQDNKTTNLKWLQSEEAPHPWLVKDNHPCPVCSAVVEWASQRCCSKACAATWRQAHRPPAKRKVKPARIKTCALCSTSYTGGGRRYCSNDCALEANARSNRDRYRERVGLSIDASLPTKPSRRQTPVS